jgi:hypothetical protein
MPLEAHMAMGAADFGVVCPMARAISHRVLWTAGACASSKCRESAKRATRGRVMCCSAGGNWASLRGLCRMPVGRSLHRLVSDLNCERMVHSKDVGPSSRLRISADWLFSCAVAESLPTRQQQFPAPSSERERLS